MEVRPEVPLINKVGTAAITNQTPIINNFAHPPAHLPTTSSNPSNNSTLAPVV